MALSHVHHNFWLMIKTRKPSIQTMFSGQREISFC